MVGRGRETKKFEERREGWKTYLLTTPKRKLPSSIDRSLSSSDRSSSCSSSSSSTNNLKFSGDGSSWKRSGSAVAPRRSLDLENAGQAPRKLEKIKKKLFSDDLKVSNQLYIIHVASELEMKNFQTGDLGVAVSGLGKALQRRGNLVEIIIPKYDCMTYDSVTNFRVLDVVLKSHFDGQLQDNKIWVGSVEGLPVYFIEPQHPANYFSRGQFYGENDDFKCFSYFSRAALELIHQYKKNPDVIHCHDWQTALVAPLYWNVYLQRGLNARIFFTCHNFEHQGTAYASELPSCGLDVTQLNRPGRMQDNSSHDKVNPVKGAVVLSNIVTTVSPTYAQEVLTGEEAFGLRTTLNNCYQKFFGILNGIDTDAWDPSTDKFLDFHFNANNLRGKMESKQNLRKQLNLSSSNPRLPLVACITMLVPQKGSKLIKHVIEQTKILGAQFVLLGSSPVKETQIEFNGMARYYENDPDVRLILKHDEALSHTIYAASDMFIIPSISEPCGLSQMIARRYGSVPIVRKTGGLNDSVFDLEDELIEVSRRNGFTFINSDEQKLWKEPWSITRRIYGGSWEELVERIMNMNFSWVKTAKKYEKLYKASLATAKRRLE